MRDASMDDLAVPTTAGMSVREVLTVLAALRDAGCRCWVAGGWGVDALVGRQTRPHRDLDLAVDAGQESVALVVLGNLGYAVDEDWRPVRVELRAAGRGWVDVHPVVFDGDGNGVQAGFDGASFSYPRACFTEGALAGQMVPCLSVSQQIDFHTGYEPRDHDLHDLEILAGLRSGSTRVVPSTES